MSTRVERGRKEVLRRAATPAPYAQAVALIRSRGRRVVSDSDFDGVTAALILADWLRREGVAPEEVEFCTPWDRRPRKNAVVIEFPERAGEGSVLIDHHDRERGSVGYVSFGGRRIAEVGEVGSVAEAVARVLNHRPEGALDEMLRYANVIDTNPPARVPALLKDAGLDPRVYLGYRLLISNPEWRERVRKAIAGGGDLGKAAEGLITLFREAGGVAEELLPKTAEEVVRERGKAFEVKGAGKVAAAKLVYGRRYVDVNGVKVDLEQAALRNVQSLLYKEHPDALAVIAYIESPRGNGLSISSKAGIAGKLAEALRDAGLAESGGGRPAIAGAQGVKFSFEEMPEKIGPLIRKVVTRSEKPNSK